MNYRHAYHAGNFADVFKHVALVLLLEHLVLKAKPMFLLDSHAGAGITDLKAARSQRTKESDNGIGRLWSASLSAGAIARYRALIAGFNPGGQLAAYPGSPLLMRSLLRDGDRLVVNELQPEDRAALQGAIGPDRRVRVMGDDGYRLIKALLPPTERRGLVLIDPPFEQRNELALMARALKDAHRRWATGIVALWYPIKHDAAIRAWHDALGALGIPRIIACDLLRWPVVNPERLNGCGLVVVNPPWTFVDDLKLAGDTLVPLLTDGRGTMRVTEIA